MRTIAMSLILLLSASATAEAGRPAVEWSTWLRLGYGAEATEAAEKRSTSTPVEDERDGVWEAAVGADVSMGGDVRVGVWAEARTSSGPVVGGELLVQAVPRTLDLFFYEGQGVLAFRGGGNADVITASTSYGYLCPWDLFGTPSGDTRYMIGVRVVASVTRAIENPRDWTATLGLEVEPIGALRYLLGIRAWY